MTGRVWRAGGPGSFQAPAGVRVVTDRTGRRWSKSRARWTCNGAHFVRWWVLVAEHGPLTETAVPNRPSPATP